MQVNSLPARAGVQWLFDGWRLVRRQPLGLPAMVVVYLTMLLVPLLLPFIGIVIAGVLGPFATVGLMLCVREVHEGRAPNPAQFAQPFQPGPGRTQLVRLGLVNAVLMVSVTLIALLVTPAAPPAPAPGEPQRLDELPWQPLAVQLLLYLPVLAVMWFAPLLAGWHQMTPVKAMFGSAVACLRNLGALLVYGVTSAVLLLSVLALVVGLASTVVSSREVMSFILAPLVLVLTAIVQASFYPMYRAIFSAP